MTWLSGLAHTMNVVLQQKGADKAWYFSLGACGVGAVIGWPAAEKKVSSHSIFTLKVVESMEEIKIFSIWDEEQWLAMPLEWRCLAMQLKRAKHARRRDRRP